MRKNEMKLLNARDCAVVRNAVMRRAQNLQRTTIVDIVLTNFWNNNNNNNNNESTLVIEARNRRAESRRRRYCSSTNPTIAIAPTYYSVSSLSSLLL